MNIENLIAQIFNKLDPNCETEIRDYHQDLYNLIDAAYQCSELLRLKRIVKNHDILTRQIAIYMGASYDFSKFQDFAQNNIDTQDIRCDYCGMYDGHDAKCMYVTDYLKAINN